MVVADVDVDRTGRPPPEDDPPLIVDADAMEPCQVASEGLEPVPRRRRKVAQCSRIVQHVQLSGDDARNLHPPDSLRDSPFHEEAFHDEAGEALDRHQREAYPNRVYRIKVIYQRAGLASKVSGAPGAGGFYVGDRIVAVNGKPVQSLDDLIHVFEQQGVGTIVELTVMRAGEKRKVRMPLVAIE